MWQARSPDCKLLPSKRADTSFRRSAAHVHISARLLATEESSGCARSQDDFSVASHRMRIATFPRFFEMTKWHCVWSQGRFRASELATATDGITALRLPQQH